MKRRYWIKTIALSWIAAAMALHGAAADGAERKPNIIYILADDLGYAELGCYGQKKIKTPYLDGLAAEGMRFTQHYAGSSVCAPSRCTLMTGLHTGHAYVRGNKGKPVIGQLPIPADTVTIAKLLKKQGYATACTGKWGLGGPDTTGLPNLQGFDHWFGYLDQWNAHSHYPEYLWRNQTKVILEGNQNGQQKEYSQDLFTREALGFIRDQDPATPFFLYVAYAVPHVSLQVPEDSLAQYKGLWPETPFPGGHYSANATPRAAYAAMVTRMDRDIGRIMGLLKERGIDDDTLVIFASDNGPTFNGGTDSKFFESAGPLRGLKQELYEGGIRVPMIARWPGHIEPGSTSDHVSAFWDVMPTLMEIAGGEAPEGIDGISFAPTLLGKSGQKRHEYLYWEYHALGGRQAIRMGDWKAVRPNLKKDGLSLELYNLSEDIGERHDVADQNPEIVKKITALLQTCRTESEHFNFGRKRRKP